MICKYCGTENPDTAKRCAICGRPLSPYAGKSGNGAYQYGSAGNIFPQGDQYQGRIYQAGQYAGSQNQKGGAGYAGSQYQKGGAEYSAGQYQKGGTGYAGSQYRKAGTGYQSSSYGKQAPAGSAYSGQARGRDAYGSRTSGGNAYGSSLPAGSAYRSRTQADDQYRGQALGSGSNGGRSAGPIIALTLAAVLIVIAAVLLILLYRSNPDQDHGSGAASHTENSGNTDSIDNAYNTVSTDNIDNTVNTDNTDSSGHVSKFADLPDDFVQQLKQESQDTITSNFAKQTSDYKLGDLVYSGCAVLSPAAGSSQSQSNVDMLYEADVTANDQSNQTRLCFPVRFSDVKESGEGSMTYGSNDGVLGTAELGGGWYSVSGYSSVLAYYQENIEEAADTYAADCTNELKNVSGYRTVTDLDSITDNFRTRLQQDAAQTVLSYMKSQYDASTTYTQPVYDSDCLLVALDQQTGSGAVNNNRYYVIVKADISGQTFTPVTIYFPVEYDEVAVLGDGKLVYEQKNGIRGHSRDDAGNWYSSGYTDTATMYRDLVTLNEDIYEAKTSQAFAAYGQ